MTFQPRRTALLRLGAGGRIGQTPGMRSRLRLHTRPDPSSAFAGYPFPPEVITLAVRWYLRLGLSYRDVEELLVERGIGSSSKSLWSRLILESMKERESVRTSSSQVEKCAG